MYLEITKGSCKKEQKTIQKDLIIGNGDSIIELKSRNNENLKNKNAWLTTPFMDE